LEGENTLRKFKTRPVLSISLLASGRKDTTRKCLDSLKPIMEQVKSELVIVDTGCDGEMQALLREYTDKIIPFTWCNDFSKARNAGMEQCRGEWFMVIDDDEWFGDVTEIVDFFKSGEYKNYGYAFYIQRNYRDRQENRYSDSWRSGLVRLEEDTRYVSSVHEYIYPIWGECKLLHSYVKHFGYIFDTQEESYKHSQRNISLLLNMLKQDRGNMRWWGQLAQEYKGIGEYRKLYDLCQEGIQRFKHKNDYDANVGRGGVFYAGKLLADLCTFRYDDAVRDYESAISDNRNTKINKARLYSFGAETYYKTEQYEKSLECCKEYIRLYDELADDEYTLMKEGSFFTRDAFEKEVRNNIYSFYIGCTLRQKDTSVLKEYFYKLGWDDDIFSIYSTFVTDVLTAFGELPFEEEFVPMARQMMSRKGPDKAAVECMGKIEKSNEEQFLNLVDIFSQVESSHWYMWYIKLRYADRTEDEKLLAFSFEKLFSCVVDIFRLEDCVWEIAGRHKVDLEPLFFAVPFDQWKAGVDSFLESSDLEEIQKRAEIVENVRKQENLRYDYFFLKKTEVEIVRNGGEEDLETLAGRFLDFSQKSIAFYGRCFKKSAFSGEMELLPQSLRLAVKLEKTMEKEKKLDAKSAVRAYEKCLGVFSPMDHVVKRYVKLLGEQEKQRLEAELEKQREDSLKESRGQKEMEALAGEVKKQMAYLAGAGMEKEAAKVYGQLKKLVPNDPELESFAYLEA